MKLPALSKLVLPALILIGFGCSKQETPVDVGSEPSSLEGDLGLGHFVGGENATIGDLVWCDLNSDGIHDEGEPGIDEGGVRKEYF